QVHGTEDDEAPEVPAQDRLIEERLEQEGMHERLDTAHERLGEEDQHEPGPVPLQGAPQLGHGRTSSSRKSAVPPEVSRCSTRSTPADPVMTSHEHRSSPSPGRARGATPSPYAEPSPSAEPLPSAKPSPYANGNRSGGWKRNTFRTNSS